MPQTAEKPTNFEYAAQVAEFLPDATYQQALRVYDAILNDPHVDDYVIAQTGLHDRFFFLTMILRASFIFDTNKPGWIYDRTREVEAAPDGYLDLWAREHFKNLSNNTKMLTPNGWTTHGELKPGDMVFSPEGKPVKVLAVTGELNDSEMYRVSFSNLQQSIEYVIHAGRGHLWDVECFSHIVIPAGHPVGWCAACLTTGELLKKTPKAVNQIVPSMLCRIPFSFKYKRHRYINPDDQYWYIRSVEPAETVPSQCIQVEGGRYLAGEGLIPTHNSTLITFAGSLQEIAKDSIIYQDLEPSDAWFRGPGQEITIGIFANKNSIARDFVAKIKREMEDNPMLPAYYQDVFWKNPKRESPAWSVDGGLICKRTSNPNEPTISGYGLVDALPVSKHFKLCIHDDTVTEKSVNTPEMILKTTEAWELSDFLTARLGPDMDARKWHIGTRYNFLDTWGVILSRKAAIPRIYPATDDGTPDGKPVFLSQRQWDKKKSDTSPSTIACQMLQNPLAGNQQEFLPEWVRPYWVRPETLNVAILVDPANSKKKGSCNTAMAVIGMDSAHNKYLLDGCMHQLSLPERWRYLKAFRNKWLRQPGIQVVRVGYERYGMQADIDHFQEMMQIEGVSFQIEEVSWVRDGVQAKDDRIRRLIPDHQNWRWFYPVSWYDKDLKEFHFECPKLVSQQIEAKKAGREYLIAKPIKRKDEEGRLYNLVEKYITNEYMFFPATTWKDFGDASSRIYDLNNFNPPQIVHDDDLLPEPED